MAYLILVCFRMIKGVFKSYSNFNLHKNLSVGFPPLLYLPGVVVVGGGGGGEIFLNTVYEFSNYVRLFGDKLVNLVSVIQDSSERAW